MGRRRLKELRLMGFSMLALCLLSMHNEGNCGEAPSPPAGIPFTKFGSAVTCRRDSDKSRSSEVVLSMPISILLGRNIGRVLARYVMEFEMEHNGQQREKVSEIQ